MRETTEAHYLHERHGLQPILRPPVKYPTALAWIPKREVLVVGTRDGVLHTIDPVMGSRIVAQNLGEPAELALHSDRKHYLVVARGGGWAIGDLGGDVLFTGKHAFLGGINCFWLKNHCVMVGDEVDGRTMLVVKGNQILSRARLPERVVAMRESDESGLRLARSEPSGLTVVSLGKGQRFAKDSTSTSHRLTYTGSHVIGITPTGIAMWDADGATSQSMRLPDITVGHVTKDGTYLGLGTRNGAVALARIDEKEKRIHPDLVKAFDGPVTTVAFAERGRWMASGSQEHLQLWSWED